MDDRVRILCARTVANLLGLLSLWVVGVGLVFMTIVYFLKSGAQSLPLTLGFLGLFYGALWRGVKRSRQSEVHGRPGFFGKTWLLAGIAGSLWIAASMILTALLTIYLVPDILEQPLSFAMNYPEGEDPADTLPPKLLAFFLIIPPLVAYIQHWVVSQVVRRYEARRSYVWCLWFLANSFLFICLYSLLNAVPVYVAGVYLVASAVLLHYMCFKNRSIISPRLYKAVDYFLIAMAIGGYLLVSDPVEKTFVQERAELEQRIKMAEEADPQSCSQQGWLMLDCLEYYRLADLKKELASKVANTPTRLPLQLEVIGYLLLSLALALRLTKTSGEFFRWHS